MEAAPAAADGTMMIDHITEMAIVTAMDKTAAVAEVEEAAEAAGRRLMVNVTTVGTGAATTATRSTTIPVGKNRRGIVETAGVTVEGVAVMTAEETAMTAMTAVMGRTRMTGPFRYRGTIGSSRSCFRADTGPRASTLTGTRTFRWRLRARTCPTGSKTLVKSS